MHSIPKYFLQQISIIRFMTRSSKLAIVDSFQEWCYLFEGTLYPMIVSTNHKNLTYCMIACVLNCYQAHWNMSLSRFNFIITYWPGKQQGLFDALSKQSYLAPKEGEAAYEQQRTTLLKAEQTCLYITTMSTLVDLLFLDQIRATSTMDPLVLDNNTQVSL